MQPGSHNPPPAEPMAELSLEQRLRLVPPEHTVRGLFLRSVLATVARRAGEQAQARCQQACGEQRLLDFFSYPVASMLRTLYAGAEELAPVLGREEAAFHLLGERGTLDFFDSTAGRALLRLSGQDLRRFIIHVPTAYRMVVNYGERRVEWKGRHCAVLHMQGDYMPLAYQQAVLHAALERITGRPPQVQGLRTGPLDARYTLRWE
jgi:uncharacterized protein (TIGR02265 family)